MIIRKPRCCEGHIFLALRQTAGASSSEVGSVFLFQHTPIFRESRTMPHQASVATPVVTAHAVVIATVCNGKPELGWDFVQREDGSMRFFRQGDAPRIDMWATPPLDRRSVAKVVETFSAQATAGMKVGITKHPNFRATGKPAPKEKLRVPDCHEMEFESVEAFLKSGVDLKEVSHRPTHDDPRIAKVIFVPGG